MDGLLISADCHVAEPVDLWSAHLPAHLRDLGPRIEARDGAAVMMAEDHEVRRFAVPGADARRIDESIAAGFLTMGASDPAARLADLDRDGVWGEVMYPNLAFFCAYTIRSAELAAAVCRVYNDWASDTFLTASPRFCPVAVLPAVEPAGAVAELTRVASRGFRAAMLPAHCDALPYNDAAWDPVWAAAAGMGVPLSFHAGTGRSQTPAHGAGGAVVNYVVTVGGPMETVAYLCGAGVLARHPDLRVVMAESGSGWLAWTLHAMDDAYREHAAWVRPRLDDLPSEYFRRQGAVTFQHDPVGLANIAFTGDACLMWGSDYPHPEGTWPRSREYLAAQLDGLDPATAARVTCTNAAAWYRFALPEAGLSR